MTIWSDVNMYGNNQRRDVPIIPNNNPSIAPIITSDLSSNRACGYYKYSKNFWIYNKTVCNSD
jgi:hypothetical protein